MEARSRIGATTVRLYARQVFAWCVAAFLPEVSSCAAQEYPVTATMTFVPPYSIYLADLASERSPLAVTLHLRDLERMGYRVGLQFSIEGMGIQIRTSANASLPAIMLDGGSTASLSGPSLAQYVDPYLLDLSGISRQTLLKTGALPEGSYTFTVQAVDYYRRIPVSSPASVTVWLLLNDPPRLRQPADQEIIPATDPQNIFFSWQPGHMEYPGAWATEYVFTLVEILPGDRQPGDAMTSSRPLFQTTTNSTSLIYGATEPALIPGNRYAYMVRVINIGERQSFRNDGFSEIFVFQFGDRCPVPSAAEARTLDGTRARISWQPDDRHSAFVIQYREEHGEWNTESTLAGTAIIPGLKPSFSYEYRIRGECGSLVSDYSPTGVFTMPASTASTYICSDVPPPPDLKTNRLQKELRRGDVVVTNDFEVVLTSVASNANGTYRGTGYVRIPWVNGASVEAEFEAIDVNEDYHVFRGNIITKYSKEKHEQFTKPVDRPANQAVDYFRADTIRLDYTISSVMIDPSTGNILVISAAGDTTTITRDAGPGNATSVATIIDSNGEGWRVNADGTIGTMPRTAASSVMPADMASGYVVRFRQPSNSRFGFDDGFEYGGHFETISHGSSEYVVPWQSIAVGASEVVEAVADDTEEFPAAIGFRTASAIASADKISGPARKIYVSGDPAQDYLEAYTTVKTGDQVTDRVVGKLMTVAYETVVNRVFIVPVNDVVVDNADLLASQINRIYGQAVAVWNVVVTPTFDVDPALIQDFDKESSDWFSSFPEKMKAFNRHFREIRSTDDDSYYIFLIRGSGSRRAGFMPFKRKFGYIFMENAVDLAATIAHELGHGAFRLEHTFKEFPVSNTDNLMDYHNGTRLKKYQWDRIHDPESMISWLKDDEDAAKYDCPIWFSGDCDVIGKLLELIKKMAAEGKLIQVFGQDREDAEMSGNDMVLDDIEYETIRLVNLVEKGKTVVFNPRDYQDFDQDFLDGTGRTDHQRGFVYRDGKDKVLGPGLVEQMPVVVKILLYESEEGFDGKRKSLRKYLYGDIPTAVVAEIMQLLRQAELDPEAIRTARGLIIRVEDPGKREEFYIQLQEKVPYHSQRDNVSIATDEDVKNNSSWLSAGERAGDIMCNLTSQAMCLEYLGISCPDPSMQFEDYLEQQRRDSNLGHRGSRETRSALARKFGVTQKVIELMTSDREKLQNSLSPELAQGRSVLLSAFSTPKGHIVRLQATKEEGLVVDDPYGKVQDFEERESGGFGYSGGTNSKNGSKMKGKDNLWTWDDIEETIIKYAEVYYFE